MESEYCFAVTWDDNEKAEAYVIKANSKEEAWSKLCATLSRASYFYARFVDGVKDADDSLTLCHACGYRLGANPVFRKGEYYHGTCI